MGAMLRWPCSGRAGRELAQIAAASWNVSLAELGDRAFESFAREPKAAVNRVQLDPQCRGNFRCGHAFDVCQVENRALGFIELLQEGPNDALGFAPSQ